MKFVAVCEGKQVPMEVLKRDGVYYLTLGEKSFTVDAIQQDRQFLSLLVAGKSYKAGIEKRGNSFSIYFYNDTIELDLFEARKFRAAEVTKKSHPSGPLNVLSPMPGKIVKIAVSEQSPVKEGDSLLIMEAMKMQNELKAPKSGIVKQVYVKEGEPVLQQQILIVLE